MSIRYVLLGVLMNRPLHGYKLKTHTYRNIFSGLGVRDGQLYPMLHKMESEGLLRKQIEDQPGSPSRHVYHITDKGREEFLEWLNSPEGEEVSFKFDFVRKDIFYLKCKFIEHLDKETAVEKIERQISVVRKTLVFFKKFRDNLLENNTNPLRVKFADYITKLQEARLEWLEELLQEVMKYHKSGNHRQ
jgi:PadR family transcriptional regulator AphA